MNVMTYFFNPIYYLNLNLSIFLYVYFNLCKFYLSTCIHTNEFQYILYFFSFYWKQINLCFISQKKYNCKQKYDTIKFSLMLHDYSCCMFSYYLCRMFSYYLCCMFSYYLCCMFSYYFASHIYFYPMCCLEFYRKIKVPLNYDLW